MPPADQPPIEERAFAILTARYHDAPELDDLLAELDEDDARECVRILSSLLRGMIVGLEVRGSVGRGDGIPRLIEMYRHISG